jgi:hypothetical protein
VANGAVLGAQAGGVLIELLPIAKAPENVVDDVLVGVKGGYRMTYIFFGLIAKHLDLCFVGFQDYAFRRDSMEANGSVLEKVLEIAVLIMGTHGSHFAYLSGSLVKHIATK